MSSPGLVQHRLVIIVCVAVAGCSSTSGPPEQASPRHARIAVTPSDSHAGAPVAAAPAPVPAAKEPTVVAATARQPPPYPLDRVSRKVPISGKAMCPPVQLVRYRGDVVRFHEPVRINAAFRNHVTNFERIVRTTAVDVYGRPPSRIRHYGSYYCRRISTWPYLVSEHGLGNAIDVGGFDFARLPSGKHPAARGRWRKAFRVRLARHWNGRARNAIHARFLRLLARRMIDSEGLFRIILGPGHPNHQDHFHLDMARWRIVNVF